MQKILSMVVIVLASILASPKSYSQTSWTGATSVNWATASNWSNGVPSATTDVVIGDGNFTGSFQPAISSSSTAKSLTIGGAVASQLTIGSTLTIKGNVNINSNGTIINGSASLSLTGDWLNAGNYTTTSNNATVIFAGINQSVGGSMVTTFRKLTVNTGSILSLNSDLTCTGASSVLVVNGTLNPNEPNTHLVSADSLVVNSSAVLKVNAASFNSNYQVSKPIVLNSGSIVEYASTLTDQVINSNLMYSTLRITGDGKMKSLAADLPLLRSTSSSAGYIYVLSGTLDLKSFAANRGTTVAGGILSVSNGAFLKIGGTNTFPTGFTTVTLPLSSTVEYNGGNQVVQGRTYGNLIISSSSGAAVKTFPATAFTIAGSLSSNVGTGTSVTFTAASNITVTGSVNIGAGTTFDGGAFTHYISGNWNNNGTFISNASTIYLKGANTFIQGNAIQNFYNLTIYGANITAPSINSIIVAGNLATTSSGTFTQPAPGTLVMTGSSKTITGININLNNLNISGVVNSTSTSTIAGNLNVTGTFTTTSGTITMSGAAKTVINSGSCTIRTFKITGSVSTATDFTITSSLTNTGTFTATAGTITFSGSPTLTGTVALNNMYITGSYVRLAANSVLGISNTLSLNGTAYLNTTSYTPNTVNYNGSQAQTVTKGSYNNLILSNGYTKTAQGVITVNNAFTISPSTTFDASTFTHTMNGNWINNGNFTAGTSTIQFSGATNTTIAGSSAFRKLKLYKSTSSNTVTLLQDITADTVDMYRGTLKTGNKVLTITKTRVSNGIILGTITRAHAFAAGVAYAFESAYTTIKFGTVSGVNSVTVNTTLGNVSDFPNGGAIGRVYTISIPSGTYTSATLRLHYEDAELNGNDESKMQLWNYNGTNWTVAGKSTNSTSSNYVEKNGLSAITNRWTFTDDGSVFAWNGSVSSDWNDVANWSLVQGVFSGVPPGATDIVQIGKTAFTNQPVISSAVKVKGITFGSTQNVLLSLSAGGSLVVDGTIQGTWSTNASHTIQSNNYPITVNNDLILSDGVNGHAINLIMGSGSLTINGSIFQLGNANITYSGSGSLKIGQDYNYVSGIFTPGTSTVTYIGTGSQNVAGIPYHHLTISKTAGTNAVISDVTSLAGNLTVSSGELDVYDTLDIAGSVNIASLAVLTADSSYISLSGNWSQAALSGFDAGSGTLVLNGTGTQSVSASSFNILSINKSSGSVNLNDNITVNEDLNLLSGTLNLSTYTINNSDAGDVFYMANGTSLYVSGSNNFPANFTTYNLDTTSNVYYDGSVAQAVAELTYGNLSFSNGGAVAKSFSGSPVINGNLVINSGASVQGNNASISLYGNWVSNGGNFVPGTSDLLLNGSGKTLTGNSTFNDFTVNGSYSVASSDMTFNGEFFVTNTGSYNAGTGVATANGDFTNSGYAFSPGTTTFSGNTHQTIRLINALVSTSTGIVNFNGSVPPDFNSTTTPTFATLNINNTGGVNPSVGWNVMVAFNVNNGAIFNGGTSTHVIDGSFTNNGTVTSTGVLDFEPYYPVNLKLNGTNFSSAGQVIFGGTGKISITGTPNQLEDVLISNTNAAGITPPSGWNMTGDFTINSNSIFNAGSFSYVVDGDLESNGILNGNTSTFTMSSTDGELTGSPTTLFNNFTISGNVTANSDFTVAGDFTNNGSYDGSLGALIMSGNKNTFIKGTTNPSAISQLTISKDSGNVVTTNVDINNVAALIVNSGIFFTSTYTISQDGGGGALVVLNGATLRIGGTNTLPAFSGYGLDVESTVDYAGTTQTIAQAGSGYGNLLISAAGNKTAVSFVPLTIAGNFMLTNGNFIANNNTHKLGGNWVMTGGTFTNTNSTILFNGTEDQYIQTTAPFNSITVNKNYGVLNISNDITINKTLGFTKGNIRTGNWKVIIPATANVSGASQTKGWIFGNLQKNVSTGSSISGIFEIGDSTKYTPVGLVFDNVFTAGNLVAKVTPTDQPQAYFSGIDPDKSVNRYWSLTNAGIGFSTASLTFNWILSDVDPGANTVNFKTAAYDGSNWLSNVVSNPLSTSISTTGCSGFGDFEIGEALTQFKWTGNAMTSDWNNKGNWLGGIPTTSMNTLIPSGISGGRLYPVLNSSSAQVKDLTIENSASLKVNDAILQVSGAISNSGNIDANNGTLEMNGTAAQTIAGSMFANKIIKNLIVSNTSVTGLTVSSTPNDTLKITGALTFGNSISKLNTGDNITFVSDSLGTARVGIVGSGNAISGKAIVEKYINTGTSAGQHAKSWQFLSVATSGQTVKESWMESGTTPGNYGTMISGPAGIAAGFDMASVAPSMKYFDDSLNNWKGVASANDAISNTKGYMVFVRGDRTVTTTSQPAKPTVLRSKGNLFIGTQLPITVRANTFQSIGNPYASPIDFALITKDASIDDAFYIYDPYLYGNYGVGGYQALSSVNNWKPVPGGTSAYPTTVLSSIIQSGQAFFVHSSSPVDGSLTITEDCKSTTSRPGHSNRETQAVSNASRQFLRASLITTSGLMADGNVVAFDKTFRNAIDGNDVIKISNSGENFGIKSSGKLLTIEAKSPLSESDTINYNISNLSKATYKLIFAPENMESTGMQGILMDKYLNTETPVSLTDSTFIDVTVNSNAGSAAADRFKIVFRLMSTLPVTITSVTAINKNADNIISWTVANESGIKQYEVEKSIDGNQFNQIAIVKANNTKSGNYETTDKNVIGGTNFYRAKIVSVDGKPIYTQIVKVVNEKLQGTISVYPNPIGNNVIHLQLNNQPTGNYKIRLYNSAGQVLISKNIFHNEGSSSEDIKCDNLPKGVYQLIINKPIGTEEVIKIIK